MSKSKQKYATEINNEIYTKSWATSNLLGKLQCHIL